MNAVIKLLETFTKCLISIALLVPYIGLLCAFTISFEFWDSTDIRYEGWAF